jgi:hypothetical protein
MGSVEALLRVLQALHDALLGARGCGNRAATLIGPWIGRNASHTNIARYQPALISGRNVRRDVPREQLEILTRSGSASLHLDGAHDHRILLRSTRSVRSFCSTGHQLVPVPRRLRLQHVLSTQDIAYPSRHTTSCGSVLCIGVWESRIPRPDWSGSLRASGRCYATRVEE